MKKKIAIAIALCLVLVGIMVTPVFAAVQKADLIPVSTDPGSGFAVMNTYTGGSLMELSLKGAVPNADYDVWMEISLLPGFPILIGTMTTNVQGNANLFANAKPIPGGLTWDTVVWLDREDSTRFISPIVTTSSK